MNIFNFIVFYTEIPGSKEWHSMASELGLHFLHMLPKRVSILKWVKIKIVPFRVSLLEKEDKCFEVKVTIQILLYWDR